MTLAEPLTQGEDVPHGARSKKVLVPLTATLIGFGLGLLIFGGGQNVAVSDSATDLAAFASSPGVSNRLRAMPGVVPARSWQAPMQSRTWQSSTVTQPRDLPPSTATYQLSPQGRQGRCGVMTQATGSAEGGDPIITILGATGLVGQELLRLIPRAWPGAKIQLFASSARTMEFEGKSYEIRAASDLEGPNCPKGDLAMVALDDDFSAKYVPILLENGYRVVDKSNCYRMDPNVPLVAGGVNSDLVTDDVKLVANPNCNTIPFCLAVAPLQRKYGLKGATVSSYQAISGAGIKPLEAFIDDCAKGYSQKNLIGTQFDATKYAANVMPHNGKTDDSGFSSEERKLVFESRKILRLPDFDVSAQCCRVPVAVGHYENAWVTFGQKVTPEMAEAILTDPKQAPFVEYKPGASGDGMSTLAGVANRDNTVAGRVRPDPRDATGATLCMTVSADNLRQGAATNAMRVASCWFKSKDPELQAACFPPP